LLTRFRRALRRSPKYNRALRPVVFRFRTPRRITYAHGPHRGHVPGLETRIVAIAQFSDHQIEIYHHRGFIKFFLVYRVGDNIRFIRVGSHHRHYRQALAKMRSDLSPNPPQAPEA